MWLGFLTCLLLLLTTEAEALLSCFVNLAHGILYIP